MRIALYSDLHLETFRRLPELAAVPEPKEPVDLVILAGDIHQGTQGLEALARLGKGHIYVSGNHEYYHEDIEILDQKLFDKAEQLGLHYLQRTSVVINGVRFLGCTLWTDYNIQPGWRFGAELVAKAFLPDYKLIRFRGKKFTPQQGIDLHQENVAWLKQKLDEPFTGKTVVVTHHAPHAGSIHPRFALSPINAAFVSDLTSLMGKADLWLHGHMHDSFDYNIHANGGSTRVIANPRGYVRKKGKAKKMAKTNAPLTAQAFENAFFNHHLVLEI